MNRIHYFNGEKRVPIENGEEFVNKCNLYFSQFVGYRGADYVYDVYATEKDFNDCIVYPFKLYQFFGCATVIDGLYVLNGWHGGSIYENVCEYLEKRYGATKCLS